ncbi:MAG TPA: hydroxymethylbilane synthase, partial [Longimicrobiaceae bacterium]|nr:hydroxymethylbilane synthase [Longimicrobiaceae bacterium]
MSSPLRIASRGSELALWQARAVANALRAVAPEREVEIRIIRTTGDRIQDVPLARIGDRGLFTKEIDAALLSGETDLAVHSLKDVPTRLPEGLRIAAVTQREDPRDVLLCRAGVASGLQNLPAGARVGTSSLRRRAQLCAHRPDLAIVDLRGNLNTRLAKLDSADYEAIVLAAAGVIRLGWMERISEYLEPDRWLPAVGQGALAVVARLENGQVQQQLLPLHDPDTAACVAAERSLLHALEGGCQVPIGALAHLEEDRVVLDGLIADLDGSEVLRDREEGSVADPQRVGERLAERL